MEKDRALTRSSAARWLDQYTKHLCGANASAIADLFHPHGLCVPSILEPPNVGRPAIQAFYETVFAEFEVLDLIWDEPVVDDGEASAEWWATIKHGDKEITEPGSLHFMLDASGLCLSWRAYPIMGEGRRERPTGWPRALKGDAAT
jgi:hypothetical protein